MTAINRCRCWNVVGKNQLRMDTIQCDSPASHEVRIRPTACGICGSDVELLKKGGAHSAHAGAPQPITMGHELVGIVEAVGHDVTSHKIGDVVAIEPGIPCEKCNACKVGFYHCCPNTKYMGTPPVNGGMADYFNWPAKWAHHLPAQLKADHVLAASVEPVACCFQAVDHRNRLAQHVSDELWTAITGGGMMALATATILKRINPREKVAVMVRSKEDRDFALSIGVDKVVMLSKSAMGSPEWVTETEAAFKELKDSTGGMVSSVIECTGSNPLLEALIKAQCILAGGSIIGLGCHYGISIDVAHLRRHELAFQPIRRSAHQFPKTLSLMAQEPNVFRSLIGGTVKFEDFGTFMGGDTSVATVVNAGAPKTIIVM